MLQTLPLRVVGLVVAGVRLRQRGAQRIGEARGEVGHRIGRVQQPPVLHERGELRLRRAGGRKSLRVAGQRLQATECRQARGCQLPGRGPVGQVRRQLVVPVEHRQELLVAGPGAQLLHRSGIRPDRQRRLAAGAAGQLQEPVQKAAGRLHLFVRLAVHARALKQLARLQALRGGDRRGLHPEVRTRHLRLVQPARGDRHAVGGRAQVPGREQAEQRPVDRVARPAAGRRREVGAHLPAPLAGADPGEHRRAHRVVRGLAVEVERRQRALRAAAGALDHRGPTVVVGVLEPEEQPLQRGGRRRPHLLCHGRFQPLVAAALKHFRATGGARHHCLQVALRRGQPRLHALARLDPFRPGRNALVVQRLLRGAAGGDQPRQRVGVGLGHEQVDHRVVRAGGARLGEHGALRGTPPVAHPHREVVALRRRLGPEVQRQLARFLARPVGEPQRPQRRLHRAAEQRGAHAAHGGGISGEPALPVAELRFPVAALAGLQAELPAELQQRAGGDQLVQERRQPAAQRRAVGRQVPHQQVGQRLRGGVHADVGPGVTRELADQEDQRAQPRLEEVVGRAAGALPDDRLVQLAQQHAGLLQTGRLFVEQEVGRHDAAERLAGGAADGVVDDAELGAELPGGAGAVDRAQRVLPEAPAHRQQRVVVDQNLLILGARADPAAGQVAADFPRVRLQGRADRGNPILALGQHHAPDHRLDVGIGQLHVDREAALQAVQRRGAGQRRLTGADEQQAVAEPLAARLDHLLDDVGAVGVLADVLLHLVENDRRRRQRAAGRQRLLQRVDELVGGDVGGLGELSAQHRPDLPLVAGEAGIGGEQRAGDDRTHVQVLQLAPKRPPCRLDRGAHPVVEAVLLEPQAELRQGPALRQTGRLEDDAEQRQPDAVPGTGAQHAGRGVQPAPAPPQGGDLGEQVPHLLRQPRQAARGGAILREREVGPQEAQHLCQMRLAAAEEAADPGRRLLRLALVPEVGLQDADQTAAVLAGADEVAQLEAQDAALVRGRGVGHGGDAVVQQGDLVGVLPVDVPVLQRRCRGIHRSSCAVIGTAR